MTKFTYKAFIGIPRYILDSVITTLNRDLNQNHITFILKGDDGKYSIEIVADIKDFTLVNAFDLGTVIGCRICAAYSSFLDTNYYGI